MSYQNAYVEALTPSVMDFGGGAFGREVGLDGVGAHEDGISAFTRRDTESSRPTM